MSEMIDREKEEARFQFYFFFTIEFLTTMKLNRLEVEKNRGNLKCEKSEIGSSWDSRVDESVMCASS